MPGPSEARRAAESELARAVDRSPHTEDAATRQALHAFVDELVREGLTPEAAVIAVKDVLVRSRVLYRFEPEMRTSVRAAMVSECIQRYFAVRQADDFSAPRSALDVTPPIVERPHRAPDAPT
ncbi:MAG TPA: hypothetical protein VL328_07015 [Gemmatimonadaceae bacterium]|jgi:hypothetical protein|nr:hypothetical protein [Gemmatimonadaceae bacterium]